jgi:hypothetical protein
MSGRPRAPARAMLRPTCSLHCRKGSTDDLVHRRCARPRRSRAGWGPARQGVVRRRPCHRRLARARGQAQPAGRPRRSGARGAAPDAGGTAARQSRVPAGRAPEGADSAPAVALRARHELRHPCRRRDDGRPADGPGVHALPQRSRKLRWRRAGDRGHRGRAAVQARGGLARPLPRHHPPPRGAGRDRPAPRGGGLDQELCPRCRGPRAAVRPRHRAPGPVRAPRQDAGVQPSGEMRRQSVASLGPQPLALSGSASAF